jgi:hypothetical protein
VSSLIEAGSDLYGRCFRRLVLIKFNQALFDGKLISQENVDQMKNGMGMSDLKLGDKTFYGHGGSMDGFRSLLVYLPEEKLAVAYTSNGMVYPAQNIIRGVLDIYWNKPFQIPTFETAELTQADTSFANSRFDPFPVSASHPLHSNQ